MTLRFNPDAWMFPFGDGWRTLAEPQGPPTARQLLRLAHLGLLEIRDTPGETITKLDCAQALELAEEARAT